MFIAIVVVAAIAGGVFRHRQTQQTIRKAIESGQTLDPATLELLMKMERPPKGPPPKAFFLVWGILMLAIGAGLALIGWFTAHTDPRQLYPGLGAGALVGLIGLGLLLSGLVIPDRPRDDRG
jgi:tryptophan-rich sensory protein